MIAIDRNTHRATRDRLPGPSDDYRPAAPAILAALPDLLRQAEAAGAVALARYLGQALSEAEGIVRRARSWRYAAGGQRAPVRGSDRERPMMGFGVMVPSALAGPG